MNQSVMDSDSELLINKYHIREKLNKQVKNLYKRKNEI